jgi:hypothetical protein
VREKTCHSPYARGFFALLEALDIIPAEDTPAPVGRPERQGRLRVTAVARARWPRAGSRSAPRCSSRRLRSPGPTFIGATLGGGCAACSSAPSRSAT